MTERKYEGVHVCMYNIGVKPYCMVFADEADAEKFASDLLAAPKSEGIT